MQQVVLHDVADGAGLLVERPAPLHAERLGHRDLHAMHVVTVPDRLQKRIRESKVDQVLHRLLAQEMIDAKDLRLVEVTEQHLVELAGTVEVAAKGLFNDDPRSLAQPEPPNCSTTTGNMTGGIAK